jgi:hypothetical protein
MERQTTHTEHGGRSVIPGATRKGAEFIREITFLDRDVEALGKRGYSNTADPWTEDRFDRPGEPPAGFP